MKYELEFCFEIKCLREENNSLRRLAAHAILMARNVRTCEVMENIESEAAAMHIEIGATFYEIDEFYLKGAGDG